MNKQMKTSKRNKLYLMSIIILTLYGICISVYTSSFITKEQTLLNEVVKLIKDDTKDRNILSEKENNKLDFENTLKSYEYILTQTKSTHIRDKYLKEVLNSYQYNNSINTEMVDTSILDMITLPQENVLVVSSLLVGKDKFIVEERYNKYGVLLHSRILSGKFNKNYIPTDSIIKKSIKTYYVDNSYYTKHKMYSNIVIFCSILITSTLMYFILYKNKEELN